MTTYNRRKKRNRRRMAGRNTRTGGRNHLGQYLKKIIFFIGFFFLLVLIIGILVKLIKGKKVYEAPEITQDYITINPYSRPGEELTEVKNIFVHYTANPGTSALQNKSYFQNLSVTGETSASAHFIIGYEGEIVQCLPLNEIGYAVKGRNYDSISIECCYVDESGKFTQETRQSLIRLLSYLLGRYDLKSSDLLRHYDEGGKMCPKYYVEHEEEWNQLKTDVREYIKQNGSYDGKYDYDSMIETKID